MSRFAVVPTHWLRHPDLTSSSKLALAVMATYADRKGYCWPSVATVAAASGLSVRAVQYALRALEDAGALRVERRVTEQGDAASNGYWLLGYDRVPGGDTESDGVVQEVQGVVQEVHHGGAYGAPRVVHMVHPNNTSSNTPTRTATPQRDGMMSFPAPQQQDCYEAYRANATNPRAFDAALAALVEGMTGAPVPIEKVGQALLDMAANSAPFNMASLRAYLRRADAPAALVERRRRSRTEMWAEAARELEPKEVTA